jgi:hypothetical protein
MAVDYLSPGGNIAVILRFFFTLHIYLDRLDGAALK